MKKFFYFWGCQIPARLPFLEKSIRLMMHQLGQTVEDLPGFTCCPERTLLKSLGSNVWELTGVRNLANAERADPEALLITPCNGCSSTLKTVAIELKEHPAKHQAFNDRLHEVKLSYRGTGRVVHLVEFLHDHVTPAKLHDCVSQPLVGMRIAVHPGCHFSSPSHAVFFDNPLHPRKFDAVIETLGAEVVDYSLKELCCGQELANTGHPDDAVALMRTKVLNLQQDQVDALAVCCPACFIQFDHKQYLLKKQGENLSLPVFFISELIALAAGATADDIGLSQHRIDCEPFLKKWHDHLEQRQAAAELLDLDLTLQCLRCQACVNDCPTCLITDKFDPPAIMTKLLQGKLDDVLEEGQFWLCMQCHTCTELCPQRFGMEAVFSALREIAVKRGIMPKGTKMGIEAFEKTGLLGDPAEKQRKSMGLEPLPKTGYDELMKLLKREKS
jgi:heterodisulfide reductase subunit B